MKIQAYAFPYSLIIGHHLKATDHKIEHFQMDKDDFCSFLDFSYKIKCAHYNMHTFSSICTSLWMKCRRRMLQEPLFYLPHGPQRHHSVSLCFSMPPFCPVLLHLSRSLVDRAHPFRDLAIGPTTPFGFASTGNWLLSPSNFELREFPSWRSG